MLFFKMSLNGLYQRTKENYNAYKFNMKKHSFVNYHSTKFVETFIPEHYCVCIISHISLFISTPHFPKTLSKSWLPFKLSLFHIHTDIDRHTHTHKHLHPTEFVYYCAYIYMYLRMKTGKYIWWFLSGKQLIFPLLVLLICCSFSSSFLGGYSHVKFSHPHWNADGCFS